MRDLGTPYPDFTRLSPVLLLGFLAGGAFVLWGGLTAQVIAATTIVFLVAIADRLAVRLRQVERLPSKLALHLEVRVGVCQTCNEEWALSKLDGRLPEPLICARCGLRGIVSRIEREHPRDG